MRLSLPKCAESWFFERFGAASERDGCRRVCVDYPGGHLSKDLVDPEGLMGHDDGGRAGRSCASDGTNKVYLLLGYVPCGRARLQYLVIRFPQPSYRGKTASGHKRAFSNSKPSNLKIMISEEYFPKLWVM